jgi:hypothetical protein
MLRASFTPSRGTCHRHKEERYWNASGDGYRAGNVQDDESRVWVKQRRLTISFQAESQNERHLTIQQEREKNHVGHRGKAC